MDVVSAFFRGGLKGCMLSRQSGGDPVANLVTNRKIRGVADKKIAEAGASAIPTKTLSLDCAQAHEKPHCVTGDPKRGIAGVPQHQIGPNGQVPYNGIVEGPNGRLIGRPIKDPNGNGRVIPHPFNRIPGPRVNPNVPPVRNYPYGKANF